MDLSAVEAFVRAAEARSFTGAAKQMGLTASGVSKAVSRLESQTGVVLLHRSTRSVGLTAEGSVFFDRCREILMGLKDAEAALQQSAQVPSGRLRIAAPITFGRSILVPALVEFRRRFPDITVEISFSDVLQDIIEEGFDIAIRIGDLPSSRLIAREVGVAHWIACASPNYLNERGRPRTPDDLAAHDCVAYMASDTRRCRDWHFMSGSREWTVRVGDAARQVVDHCDALVDAALADSGIVYVHNYVAAEHLRSGRLERVLEGFGTPKRSIHIIYPTLRQLSPKVRSFVDFAVDAMTGYGELYRTNEACDVA
ncbi:LysR family transcriptional regulator [Paraburkholderia rhizosphaerae]|uniref:DNA-binding transcriptional LysR family regulator n=1 Tax=Paraburkholderia rhizosphaerae TaxID=480658 RepID=A0A4R8L6J5_9BURK|nr:LysR family transcriptional regulator [Paraburkholderia rhizosphaerae]TDY38296.1 DNA-binding transcriptional LysR family regulator [Paraburkholderia rhizosphaerae]